MENTKKQEKLDAETIEAWLWEEVAKNDYDCSLFESREV